MISSKRLKVRDDSIVSFLEKTQGKLKLGPGLNGKYKNSKHHFLSFLIDEIALRKLTQKGRVRIYLKQSDRYANKVWIHKNRNYLGGEGHTSYSYFIDKNKKLIYRQIIN